MRVSGSKRCRRTSTGGVGVDGEQEEGEEVTLTQCKYIMNCYHATNDCS